MDLQREFGKDRQLGQVFLLTHYRLFTFHTLKTVHERKEAGGAVRKRRRRDITIQVGVRGRDHDIRKGDNRCKH